LNALLNATSAPNSPSLLTPRLDDGLGGIGWKGEFTPEFKLEAVKLVAERGVSKSQAARDPGFI
jgi:hypothetical protein